MNSILKKIVQPLIMLVMAQTAYAGLYLDAGMGYGMSWVTETKGDSYWWGYNSEEKKHKYNPEIGYDLGLKVGGGLSKIGLFFVCEFSVLAPLVFPEYNDNSVLPMIGPGIVFYPTQNLQLGFSFSASFLSDTGDNGYAYNFSIAYDFGYNNHGLLLGIKY
jgi:hypothetical protein